jgi:hypothetical protein
MSAMSGINPGCITKRIARCKKHLLVEPALRIEHYSALSGLRNAIILTQALQPGLIYCALSGLDLFSLTID